MSRSRRGIHAPVLVLLLLWLPSASEAAAYFVRQGGDDRADGKTPATAFRSVLRAAQVLNHGDDVVIGPGMYRESVFLAERFGGDQDKGDPILISGDESGQQTGDAPGPVVIEPARPDAPALHLYRTRLLTVSGLTFRGGEGLRLEQCRYVKVQRCTFDECSRGLAAERTRTLGVESCVFTRCTIGAFIKQATSSALVHLSVAGSTSAGVVVLESGTGSLRNSLLTANNSNLVADAVSAAHWHVGYNVLTGATGPYGDVPTIHNAYEWSATGGSDHNSVHVAPAFVGPETFDLRVDPAVGWGGGLPGMAVGQYLAIPRLFDRDGKPFRRRSETLAVYSAGAYDYPDPEHAGAWAKLPVKIEGKGLRRSAGVYREDGTLVRTLVADAAGVTELWWDGLDDTGQPAPAGKYQVRAVSHNVRVVDDGNYGDNGNPAGTYNPDNPERIVALPDGGFVVSTPYDEAGMPLRRYTASGQSVFAANLAEKDYVALARWGEDLLGVVGRDKAKLVRLKLPGERRGMPNGDDDYPLVAGGVAGLAVLGDVAYVSLPAANVVRLIDLKTGAKQAEWAVEAPGDVAVAGGRPSPLPSPGVPGEGERGEATAVLWVLSKTDVVRLDADGKVVVRFPTGLAAPAYLAASADRLAVVDRSAGKMAILDASDGRVVRQFGKERAEGEWTPVGLDVLRDPRGVAFLADGRLAVAENARLRILWPDEGKISQAILSNFMDTSVVHPTQGEYVYSHPGIFRVDPKTGAWEWLVEAPKVKVPGPDGKEVLAVPGSPSHAVVLGGRPFVAYHRQGGHVLIYDVSQPLKPRLAREFKAGGEAAAVVSGWAYGTFCFNHNGDIVGAGAPNSLQFDTATLKGLDAQNNPVWDFANVQRIGTEKEPGPRGMGHVGAVTNDRKNGDLYYLAVTSQFNKMVPGWGADGTGVGKSAADGTARWFALSSGGNYMSVSAVHDGKETFVFAGKSFGGQLDLFDADGLRLATGNWSWPANYQIGFVDLRYGVHAYVRPDGKVGAYVEDDAIGRFARARVDGAETIKRTVASFDWPGTTAAASAEPPLPDRVAGKALEQRATVAKLATPLPVDGKWEAWEKAGVEPQIVILPASITFRRNVPDDLLQTFRQGTSIGALAHDGQNFYTYFVVTDDTMHFDSETSGTLWMYDGVELWLEEEQFGIAFTKDGTPALHKFRHHDRVGTEWKAGYALPREAVWGEKIADLSTHPLGRRLAGIVGTPLAGRSGYAVMAKIPMEEVKLVGGIAGRGKEVLALTGKPGEVLRIGVTLGAVTSPGREQDYKVSWPAGLMFSDPTRSYPFVLGE